MKLRIKNTPFWGEVMSDSDENDMSIILMKDGSISIHNKNELTSKTMSDSLSDFMWSVFCEKGSIKNKIIFFLLSAICGVVVGILI